MPAIVNKTNTKIYRGPGGWIKAVYDTGEQDAEGNAITRQVSLSQASIELSAGVLLPKARIKAIVEAALNESAGADQELEAL